MANFAFNGVWDILWGFCHLNILTRLKTTENEYS